MEKLIVEVTTPYMKCSADLLSKFEQILDIRDYMIHHTPFDDANYLAQEKVKHPHVGDLMLKWEQRLKYKITA